MTDAQTGDSLPSVSVVYKGHNVTAISGINGHYTIDRHEGWNLTFSAIGYKPRIVAVNSKTKQRLNIQLKPDNHQLAEVKVKAKRQRYSRKDNPAVELMKRVIAAKKQTNLKNHDFYQYNRYQKLTLAANDLTPQQLEQKPYSTTPWLLDMVEPCAYNGKLILPINVEETVSQQVYRRDPHTERTIIRGQQTTGVSDLIETGDILNVVLRDVFTDVNLYDDQIRLLQYPFTSPIGKDAIAFYRFYIEDTVKVGRDSCYHLQFMPNNQQDFGFRGDLYILKDSTLHVRRAELSIPKRSDVNFVENLKVQQEYEQLDNGEWVLTVDDMITELQFAKFIQKAIVIRTTRLSDYAFDPLPKSLFKGKRQEVREADAQMRGEDFWNQYRQVELTKSESSMDAFMKNVQNIKGFKYIIFGAKALIENFVETGSPSKVDLGPMNTIVTRNFIDGWRVRASAQSTANLNKHLFFKGYYAHGFDSKKNYYDAEVIYSFNKKEYLPREFPKRTLSFQSTYDIMSPSDRFLPTDKDNMFVAFKWATVDKMMFYNRQKLDFDYEFEGGLKLSASVKAEENEAVGAMDFGRLRTTELHAGIRFAPGETYINTKQRRLTVNLDAPVFTVGHTWGVKGFLGGDYNYHYTEVGIYKRFWMKSWGKIDCYLQGGALWNQVPYPLLLYPAANLSYIMEDGTFNLINNMEFLNDRYASLMVSWDMNGKLLNRIPLIRGLKWREFFGFNMLWGTLTDRNNPATSSMMPFPVGSYIMDKEKPYCEAVIGVHNIFKLLHVEYVRRLTYLELPTSQKDGVRFMFRMTF